MKLTNQQIERVQQVWQNYVANGEKFLNASKEFTQQELDQCRRETIPEVLDWLSRFLKDDVPLEEFKTVNDGINKRNRLWGFQGINGQMFFNVLTKNSQAGNRREEFIALLKKSLPVPEFTNEAKATVEIFSVFVRDLAQYSQDSRGAPKIGSIPYFLSYFWQIQKPDEYPIYYSSMVNALKDTDVWFPTGNISDDYVSFYELNHQLKETLSQFAGRELHLWDIEHAFWVHMQVHPQPLEPVSVAPVPLYETAKTLEKQIEELPDSYLPPVVSVLQRLAANDERFSAICRRSGKAIEKVFEERLSILFGMLGFETELLGQGRGRVPDGVAVSEEFRYAIIYDAKVRQQAYTMGTDERAIREYIVSQGERLRRRGIRNLYFMVISSTFTGNHDDAIRGMKIETNVNEVLLVEVGALLAMLEGKLRNPTITLGPDGIQRLLAFSGLLTEGDVREFMGL